MSISDRPLIAVFGSNWQQRYFDSLKEFFARLTQMPVRVCVERAFGLYLRAHGFSLDDCDLVGAMPHDASMVISIGGDGTFLRAVDWIEAYPIPVMGINTGHLGYLAGFSLGKPEEVEAALRGRYDESRRMVIEVKGDMIPTGFRPYALNEIAVAKGDTTSMVSIRAYVDGRFVADYLADGLIVSTPTGSTAYNLSCGGPILQPTMQSIILTPIAPHSLTLRPIVVAAESEITLEVSSRGESCHVGVDGRTVCIPSDGRTLRICRAPFSVTVAQPPATDFASTLRAKLGWASR
ncbi:MAG: NAD(+)/NADH kinase [Muribaculaceae bacterium]|nr:NAD(+)/NADH kinase [Muribaculaceae bacterium]